MKYIPSCHRLGDGMFSAQRVEKICNIVKIMNFFFVRFINVACYKGFEVKESNENVSLVKNRSTSVVKVI